MQRLTPYFRCAVVSFLVLSFAAAAAWPLLNSAKPIVPRSAEGYAG